MKKIILVFSLVFFWFLTGNCQWTFRYNFNNPVNRVVLLDYNVGLSGNNNGIYKTTDFGLNWTIVYQCMLRINNLYFLGSTLGWACDSTKILKTTNGGDNWTLIFDNGNNPIYRIYFLNPDKGFILTYILGSGNCYMLMTTNGGYNWVTVVDIGPRVGKAITFVNDTVGYTLAGNRLYRTINGGYSWNELYYFPYIMNDIFFKNMIGYAVGYNGDIYKTTNEGTNWNLQQSSVNVILKQASFINENTGYVCGNSGRVLKTTNGGAIWEPEVITTQDLTTIKFFNGIRGWCASLTGSLFVCINTIYPPILTSPPINSLVGTLTPTLVWSEANNALEYIYQVSPSSDFNPIVDSGTISTNYHQIPSGILQSNITYFWRVKAKNGPDTSLWSWTWNFLVLITNNNNNNEKIASYLLLQNYPNPFNSTTTIKYNLLKDEYVELKVYDILGRNKKTIISEKQIQGFHSINFDAGDLPSGIYYYKLSTKDFVDIKRMVLIK